MEAKSFLLEVGLKKGALCGVIEEHNRGFSSWVGVGPAILWFFLEGIKRAYQTLKEAKWGWSWKEEGIQFSMIKDVNQAGPYIRLQVTDVGEKKFTIFITKGQRSEEGWRALASSLRELGVRTRLEVQKGSEVFMGKEKVQQKKTALTEGKIRGGCRSFAEVLKASKPSKGVVRVEIEEIACKKRITHLERCLDGRWSSKKYFLFDLAHAGKEMSQKWDLKGDLGLSKLGDEEIWLEFESKGEALRVLNKGTRKFGTFNVVVAMQKGKSFTRRICE